MTTAVPVSPSNTPPPPQKTDDSAPAALNFAFPFKKSDGKDFIDEHQFNVLLARESGGFFPVSDSGMWHGGIHITAAGAGTSLDLKNGVRCLADGEVVAYRVDRTYPVSELPALAGKAAVKATYSTGFALVRHTTEFPRGKADLLQPVHASEELRGISDRHFAQDAVVLDEGLESHAVRQGHTDAGCASRQGRCGTDRIEHSFRTHRRSTQQHVRDRHIAPRCAGANRRAKRFLGTDCID